MASNKKSLTALLNHYLFYCLAFLFLQGCEFKDEEGTVFFWGDSHISRWDLKYDFQGNVILNEGIIGDSINGLIKRLQNPIENINGSKCFVEIGTNDCIALMGSGISDLDIITNIKIKYDVLLSTLEMKYSKIYILSIVPIGEYYDKKIARRSKKVYELVNINIEDLCKTHNCFYIDVSAKLKDDRDFLASSLTTDGLHLNRSGYEILSSTIKSYVN